MKDQAVVGFVMVNSLGFRESSAAEVFPVLLPVDGEHLALALVGHHLALHLEHLLLHGHGLVRWSVDDLGLVLHHKAAFNGVSAMVGSCAGIGALV